MLQTLQRSFVFIVLVLAQVLVLNHVQIAGYATPSLFIYYILILNSDTSRNSLLLQSFLIGLCVDIFSNTPGMNAAAATLIAFVRRPILHMHMSRDIAEDFEPSIRTLGFFQFLRYVLDEALIFTITLQLLSSLSFAHGKDFLLRIATDTLMTIFFIMCTDILRRKK